jgi:DNA-directed RNA polymerase delta subunit
MDRQEIRERARFLYGDSLQYAIAREDEVDTNSVRENATLRLTREMEGLEIYELCRGMIDSVAKNVERQYIVDFETGQLSIGSAIRTGDNTLCPVEKARLRDWLAFDEIRERVFQSHAAKRAAEREQIAEIVERLSTVGGDPTTLEACPEKFAAKDERAA